MNSGSRATFFRHSAVLSPPAILLRLSIVRACNEMDQLFCGILHHSYAGNFFGWGKQCEFFVLAILCMQDKGKNHEHVATNKLVVM